MCAVYRFLMALFSFEEENSHFVHIGLAFVLDVMDNEAVKCVVEDARRMIERVRSMWNVPG